MHLIFAKYGFWFLNFAKKHQNPTSAPRSDLGTTKDNSEMEWTGKWSGKRN